LREFLAIHYKFNTRLDTEFWRACRDDVDILGAQTIVDYYQENGPSTLWNETLIDPHDINPLDGYYTILMGQDIPYNNSYQPSNEELQTVRRIKETHKKIASNGIRSEEALQLVRDPSWTWDISTFKGR